MKSEVARRARRAASMFLEGMSAKVTRLSARMALSALFGLLALIWVEVTLYEGLSRVMAPPWAALATACLNVALAGAASRRLGRGRAARLLRSAADRKLEEARHELRVAGDRLREATVVPFNRYKAPVAIGGAFVVGLLASSSGRARAPRRRVG